MTELEQQVERCRERLLTVWPTAIPLAIFGVLCIALAGFVHFGQADRLVALLSSGVLVAAALIIGLEQRAKRRKTLLGLATAKQAVLGFHDLSCGLVFVTPAGVFIEAVGYVVPFSARAGAPHVTACTYLPYEHVLLVETRDTAAEFHLPAAITPQQAEEACRLRAAAAAPPR